jgi:hypothetical protein
MGSHASISVDASLALGSPSIASLAPNLVLPALASAGAEILGGTDALMEDTVAGTASSTVASDAFSGSRAGASAASLGCSKPRTEDGLHTRNNNETSYCYRHNLAGPRDGPRATWAAENHHNGLRIDFCANVSRAKMAVYLRIV